MTMKDEDIEILLEAVKDLEKVLSATQNQIARLEKKVEETYKNTEHLGTGIHKIRLSVDNAYKKKIQKSIDQIEFEITLNTAAEIMEIADAEDIDVIAETKLRD